MKFGSIRQRLRFAPVLAIGVVIAVSGCAIEPAVNTGTGGRGGDPAMAQETLPQNRGNMGRNLAVDLSAAGTNRRSRNSSRMTIPDEIANRVPIEPSAGATKASRTLLALLVEIEENLAETRYQARTKVDHKRGIYRWDCSGMSGWILRKSAPAAFRALKKSRPLARDFYRVIERAPTKRAKRGWQRLASIEDARAGDVFAWLKSPLSKSKITGHVGFLLGPAVRAPNRDNIYMVRIADSTRLPHDFDSRVEGDGGGYGTGVIAFIVDDDGEISSYAWFGTHFQWTMPAPVVIGRVHR